MFRQVKRRYGQRYLGRCGRVNGGWPPAQLALIAGYTVLITLFLPHYWLHPYGPISKNLPLAAAIALLWALEPPPKASRA